MPISGDALVDAAPSARSAATLGRNLLRLVVLLGGAVAAIFLAASAASADDHSLTSGLDDAVGQVAKVVPPTVAAPKVELPKIATPKVTTPKAELPKVELPQATKSVVAAPQTTTKTVTTTVQKTTKPVTSAVAPVTHAVANLQPSKGIPAVDDVVRGVTKTTTGTVTKTADAALGKTPLAPVVHHVVHPVVHQVDATVTHAADAADGPVGAVAPVTQAVTSGAQPSTAVLAPTTQTASLAAVPSATVVHRAAARAAAGSPVLAASPLPAVASSGASATKAGTFSGTRLQGSSPRLPTELPSIPTAPAQGPVVQMGSGQSAGELAVLDAAPWAASGGSTRPEAGDEGTPLSRVLVVDTRPA